MFLVVVTFLFYRLQGKFIVYVRINYPEISGHLNGASLMAGNRAKLSRTNVSVYKFITGDVINEIGDKNLLSKAKVLLKLQKLTIYLFVLNIIIFGLAWLLHT